MATKSKSGPAPANTAELCLECPALPLDPTATHVSCPHGSWTFTPDAPPTAAQDLLSGQLSDLLDSLSVEQLQGLLDAKTAADVVTPPDQPKTPAKATPAAKA